MRSHIRFEDRDLRLSMLKIINDIEHDLTKYFSVVALINFVVGLIAGAIAYFIGLPNPVAWGGYWPSYLISSPISAH